MKFTIQKQYDYPQLSFEYYFNYINWIKCYATHTYYTSNSLCCALLLVIILLNKSTKKSQSNTIVHEEKNLELRKTFHKIDEKTGLWIQYPIRKRLVDAIFKIGALVQFDKLDYFLYIDERYYFRWFCLAYSKYDSIFCCRWFVRDMVPGAFMSIISYNLLNQAVNEHGYSNLLKYWNTWTDVTLKY